MALEQLLAALERDADASARGLIEEAVSDAARTLAAAEERVGRIREEEIAVLDRRLEAAAQARVAAARREALRKVLVAREGLLDRIFAAAASLLQGDGPGTASVADLPAAIPEALDYVGERPAVVRCPPDLAGEVKSILAARPEVKLEVDAAVGAGVLVAAADGSVEVDVTLEARLSRLRPSLSVMILRRLEGAT